jgi:uncharacterized membrane protein YoaK (UPF0700 family)
VPEADPAESEPARNHARRVGFPFMELPFIGFLLALSAGSLNAWTLANAATFSTAQSGNVVSSGYWLAQGNWPKFAVPFISIIAFGLGSAVCGVIMTTLLRTGHIFTASVLIGEAVLLVTLGILAITLVGDGSTIDLTAEHRTTADWFAYGISFVAGAMGNAFHKIHGMLFGAVAVTFVIQMAFNFLTQAAFKREGINNETNLYWAGVFFLTLLGFGGGGAIGFAVDRYVTNGASIFIPAIIALALVWAAGRRGFQNIDPTPGGSFA